MRHKLKSIRKSLLLTQEMAAEEIGISRSHYSQIEEGVRDPSLCIALRMKQVFGYPDDDIFLNANTPKESRIAT